MSRIEKSVFKLETFIAEILDYSRNKRQNVEIEEVDIREMCEEIIEKLHHHHHDLPVTTIEYALEEESIFQDKTRMKIILTNLLSNAMRYRKRISGHHPYIRISSEVFPDYTRIHIQDNGEGIRKEAQDRIFEMFYRGNEVSNGSGLGLYIAREAVLKIGGQISFTSKYGDGSVFTVDLRKTR